MRKLRLLFIIAGMVGAFYLNGAANLAQASPATIIYCQGYSYSEGNCVVSGMNCDNGTGNYCTACNGGSFNCETW
jgi:hypothetical protein